MNAKLVVVFLASCLAIGLSDDDHGSNAEKFTKASFSAVVNEKPLFVMFFAPWCGHCKRLAPTWDDLAKEMNEGSQVTVGTVDCTVETALCSDHGVRGYPTVKFFNKNTEGDKFSGPRTLENLKEFIETKLNEGEKPQDPVKDDAGSGGSKAELENGVYALTAETFDGHVAKGHHFVKFYAPWCGHCKRLVPVWEELGGKLKDSGRATVAKVDCTQHAEVCSKFSVRGYPTLIWITDGQKNEEYSAMRDIDSLMGFVDRLTNTVNQERKASEDGKVPNTMVEPEKEGSQFVLTDATIDAHLMTGNHFVKFYAPWCGHCKRLAPTWADLAKDLEGNSDVTIGKLDCTNNKDSCVKYGVSGYPSLIFFSGGNNKGRHMGGRDLASLKEFVNKMDQENGGKPKDEEIIRQKIVPDPPKGKKDDEKDDDLGVVELNDGDFAKTIEVDLTLVMFADDKCETCKAVSKVLEQVADAFDDQEMMIAVINCQRNQKTCDKENVKGDYPVLRLYNNGKFVGLYTGERTLEAMKGYVGLQLKTLGGHGGEL